VLRALARGHGLCSESMVSGGDNRPFLLQFQFFGHTGGSNGYRTRLWKIELQHLANELKLPITVCHLPPGTSKWNKVEHRLFSFISMNWRGKPLRSYRTVVQLIAATRTYTGLTVRAELDENKYPKGIKVSDAQFTAINISHHSFHGDWNYTISPNV
jgi:Rhodopirellula transposase DDE domain